MSLSFDGDAWRAGGFRCGLRSTDLDQSWQLFAYNKSQASGARQTRASGVSGHSPIPSHQRRRRATLADVSRVTTRIASAPVRNDGLRRLRAHGGEDEPPRRRPHAVRAVESGTVALRVRAWRDRRVLRRLRVPLRGATARRSRLNSRRLPRRRSRSSRRCRARTRRRRRPSGRCYKVYLLVRRLDAVAAALRTSAAPRA